MNQTYFSESEKLSMVAIVATASMSVVAVASAFGLICYYWVIGRRTPFVQDAFDCAFLSLLVSDLLQAIGNILDSRWIVQGLVVEGSFCTAQGIIKQAADVGIAFSTLLIGIHTWINLFLEVRACHSLWVGIGEAVLVWLVTIPVLIIWGAVHPQSPDDAFYGDTGYWCWIQERNGVRDQIVTDVKYMFMWFTWVVNAALYATLALRFAGYVVKGRRWYNWSSTSHPARLIQPHVTRVYRFTEDGASDDDWSQSTMVSASVDGKTVLKNRFLKFPVEDERKSARDIGHEPRPLFFQVVVQTYPSATNSQYGSAGEMTLYPLVYGILIAPISIIRFLTFSGHDVTFATTVTADTIYALSGLLNALLFSHLRPALLQGSNERAELGELDHYDVIEVTVPRYPVATSP